MAMGGTSMELSGIKIDQGACSHPMFDSYHLYYVHLALSLTSSATSVFPQTNITLILSFSPCPEIEASQGIPPGKKMPSLEIISSDLLIEP
jgi:hypothetical protein